MMSTLFDCDVHEILHVGKHTAVYRARRRADDVPVVLKVLEEVHPSPRRLAALRHEHALLRQCASADVVRTFGVAEDQGRFGIVMEDFGGVALKATGLAGKLTTEEFLEMAIRIAEAVEGVHHRRVVHKDINPSNLLVHPGSRQIKLIDFGIATVVADEDPGFGSLRALEGTIAYISPEQTGRMNRSVDERTDLYSLGVTLFELLTGRRPFVADDPLELAHCHIARRPPSPAEVNPAVPRQVAEIILKLLAKDADERYRSAHGLRLDLARCLEELRRGGDIEPFALGADDRSDRLHFPQHLQGRDAEAKRLLDAFERSTRGAVLMLVFGYAGIGKTALIREVHRPLTARRGYFVAGKYDQIDNAPYSAFIQAIRALVQYVLTENEARLGDWRDRMNANLGTNAAVLAEVCPPLCAIFGPQPSPPPLLPDEARNRLHEAVHQLVALFARPEHPLCLFIDDLQWADADSLKLLRELMHMARDQALFVLGAYRDNEVGESHPLRSTIEQIEAQGSSVERLALAPLAPDDVASLLQGTLGAALDETAHLVDLVLARTGGNPFFVRAFMTSLRAEGLLTPSPSGWRFDIDEIRKRGVTDNVVELLSSRIGRLPGATQDLLRLAACIGSRFDLGTLAGMAARPVAEAGRDLWDAVAEGLVLPLDRVHSPVEVAASPDLRFRFAHDRIQEAALAALDEDSRVRLHRDVGRKLLVQFDAREEGEKWLFEIVGQLNRGRPAISDPAEIEELARLNLRAARKALEAAATEPALRYAQAGIALLSEEDWETWYELARDLHDCGIEAAFGCAALDTVQSLSAALLRRARTPLEEARVRRIEGQVLYAQMRATEAIDTFSLLLARLGFPLPSPATPEAIAEEMRRTEEALAACGIENLIALPRCTNEEARAALEVLSRMVFLTISTSHGLFAPVICKAVQISLVHGNTAESAFAYTYFGVLLTHAEDFDRAARIGNAAIALSDVMGDSGVRALVYIYAQHQLIHWKVPLSETARYYLEAYRYAMEAGSPFSASCAATCWSGVRIFTGDPLGEVAADMERYAEVAIRFRQNVVKTWHDLLHQFARNLCEEVPDPTRFGGRFYDEDARLPADRADGGAMANYHLCKMMLCYMFGDFARAAVHAREREPFTAVTATSTFGPIVALWGSLVRLAVLDRFDEAERARILETVAENERKLEVALPHCPKTIAHKLALVQAERAHVEGRDADARTAFERAVTLARGSGYVHEEALACERLARFHLKQREVRQARTRFREAHEAYLRWGAVTKAKALEHELPHLVPRIASVTFSPVTLTGTRGGEWDLNVLDLISVINASQAISREVDRDRLLMRLMDLLIETGGAESGVLLRERDGQWLVEAEKSLNEEQVSVFQSMDMTDLKARGFRGAPESVINYVARTGEPLVIDDAMASPQFRRDPYVARHQVVSILCFLLPRQAERRSLVYLENNLMKGAFTPGRIKILLLLSTQAMISLDNAVLYRTLERRVEERTRELQEKNEELVAAMARLREAQDRLIVQDRLASLGTLTAGVAHELRNPLNFVNNFAQLGVGIVHEAKAKLGELAAGRAGVEEPLTDLLDDLEVSMSRIQESGRRMDGIVGSMLEHSGGGKGERQETDLNGLVEKFASLAVQELRGRRPPVDVALDLELDPSSGPLLLVPQEISRVILNLVNNAGHAVNAKQKEARDPRYRPHIRVATRNIGDRVELRIHDNGVGIPAEIRDRIFTPFFTTKQTGEGTGLGLSICYDIIVKSHRGNIRFLSKEGEFTEFVISLPRQLA
ncbi:trifunctional serine/threonine-protein kinase/ATP-binding protein/sensor histidine kinase [Sorangium sp. So ce1151]|uniref:trifunctional serine/threonine-protein kinase/ATP-binding protein/sensor histidine kinase n=1 Tax=Sorangium sp. So ce1151 TaxID=3133332 RepID=UPI003F62C4D9